jgi:hypothetical protein
MFCTQCGNKIDDGVNFCANCGVKIEKSFGVENSVRASTKQTGYLDSGVQSPIKRGVKIECNYDGALIQVVNGLTKEGLYIDGSLVDQHYTGFNAIWGKTLILKAINYPFISGEKTTQVFCKSGLISNKFMLCIDNVYVAGDTI